MAGWYQTTQLDAITCFAFVFGLFAATFCDLRGCRALVCEPLHLRSCASISAAFFSRGACPLVASPSRHSRRRPPCTCARPLGDLRGRLSRHLRNASQLVQLPRAQPAGSVLSPVLHTIADACAIACCARCYEHHRGCPRDRDLRAQAPTDVMPNVRVPLGI
jgi:hypothetical protein